MRHTQHGQNQEAPEKSHGKSLNIPSIFTHSTLQAQMVSGSLDKTGRITELLSTTRTEPQNKNIEVYLSLIKELTDITNAYHMFLPITFQEQQEACKIILHMS